MDLPLADVYSARRLSSGKHYVITCPADSMEICDDCSANRHMKGVIKIQIQLSGDYIWWYVYFTVHFTQDNLQIKCWSLS